MCSGQVCVAIMAPNCSFGAAALGSVLSVEETALDKVQLIVFSSMKSFACIIRVVVLFWRRKRK